jgi:hypothetical protein
MRSIHFPYKANTVLIVDPNAVLSGAIPFQSLKAITRRETQVAQIDRCLNLIQFASRDRLNCGPAFV